MEVNRRDSLRPNFRKISKDEDFYRRSDHFHLDVVGRVLRQSHNGKNRPDETGKDPGWGIIFDFPEIHMMLLAFLHRFPTILIDTTWEDSGLGFPCSIFRIRQANPSSSECPESRRFPRDPVRGSSIRQRVTRISLSYQQIWEIL